MSEALPRRRKLLVSPEQSQLGPHTPGGTFLLTVLSVFPSLFKAILKIYQCTYQEGNTIAFLAWHQLLHCAFSILLHSPTSDFQQAPWVIIDHL